MSSIVSLDAACSAPAICSSSIPRSCLVNRRSGQRTVAEAGAHIQHRQSDSQYYDSGSRLPLFLGHFVGRYCTEIAGKVAAKIGLLSVTSTINMLSS
jgi:hypothetical protein